MGKVDEVNYDASEPPLWCIYSGRNCCWLKPTGSIEMRLFNWICTSAQIQDLNWDDSIWIRTSAQIQDLNAEDAILFPETMNFERKRWEIISGNDAFIRKSCTCSRMIQNIQTCRCSHASQHGADYIIVAYWFIVSLLRWCGELIILCKVDWGRSTEMCRLMGWSASCEGEFLWFVSVSNSPHFEILHILEGGS